MNDRLNVSRECLGEVLHTNMRKYCDSMATSLAYNIIEVIVDSNPIKRKIWDTYLDLVWEELQSVTTHDEASSALQRAVLELDCDSPLKNALRLSLLSCNEVDFVDMAMRLLKPESS